MFKYSVFNSYSILAATFIFLTAICGAAPPEPLLYLPLRGNMNEPLKDHSPAKHPTRLYGPGPIWMNTAKMLYFNGEKNYLSVSETDGFDLQNFTWSFWVDPAPPSNARPGALIRGPFGLGYTVYAFKRSGQRRLDLYIRWAKSLKKYSVTVPGDKVSHYAFSFDGKTLKIYVNGEKKLEKPGEGIVKYHISKNGRSVLVGASYHNYKWHGGIADVKLFGKALSEKEIKQLTVDNNVFSPLLKKVKKSNKLPIYYPGNRFYGPDFNKSKNLAQNPSFEAGLRYWHARVCQMTPPSAKKLLGTTDKKKHSGRYSLFLKTVPGEIIPVMFKSFVIPVVPGKEYTLSFYASSSSRGGFSLIRWGGSGGPKRGKTINITPGWKRYSWTFRVKSNVLSIGLKPGSLRNAKEAKIFYIDDVQIEQGNTATEYTSKPVFVSLKTSQPDNLMDETEKVDAKLSVYTVKPEISGKIKLTVESQLPDRQLLVKTYKFKTDKTGVAEISLPEISKICADRGFYKVRADYEIENGFSDFQFYRLGVMKFLSGKNRHRFLIGSYYPPNLIPDYQTGMKRYMQVGYGSFRTIRPPVPEFAKLAEHYGVRIYSCLLGHRYISSPGDGRFYTELAYFKKLAKQGKKPISVKYGYMNPKLDMRELEQNSYERVKANSDIKYWTLTLEPNHKTAELPEHTKRFIETQKAMIRGARRASKTVKIIGMGPTNLYYSGGLREIMVWSKAGLLNLIDIVSAHPYRQRPDHPDLDRDIKRLMDYLKQQDFKGNVWFTEGLNFRPYFNLARYGINIVGTTGNNFWRCGNISYDVGYGEKMAAAYITRMLVMALKYNVKSFDDNYNWHIFDAARQLRLTCWGGNTLLNLLGDAEFVKDIDFCDDIKGYLFRDADNRPVAVFWNRNIEVDDMKRKASVFTIPFPADKVEVFSLTGKKLPVKSLNDIPAGLAPIFIRGAKTVSVTEFSRAIDKATSPSSAGYCDFRIQPYSSTSLKLMVSNRRSKLLNGKLNVEFAGKQSCRSLELKPKATKFIPLPLPKKFTGPAELTLKTSFKPDKEPKAQEYAEKFKLMTAKKTAKPIKIDGDLSEWSNKYAMAMPAWFKELKPDKNKFRGKETKYNNLLNSNTRKWRGKDDLSATMYTAWDRDNFYLGLKIKDDVVDFGNPFYHHDSVQVYFDSFLNGRYQLIKDFGVDDYCYNFFMEKGKTKVSCSTVPEQQLSFLGKISAAKGIKAAIKPVPGGYNCEMAFPLRYLQPLSLKAGNAFGFALIVNENDKDFMKRALTTTGPGTHPYRRPNNWGVMLLTK